VLAGLGLLSLLGCGTPVSGEGPGRRTSLRTDDLPAPRRMTPDGPRVVLAPAHAEPDLVVERPVVRADPAPAPGTHKVVAGETLYRIARSVGITPGALAEMNGLSVSTPLAVGQVLVVPAPPGPPRAEDERARGASESDTPSVVPPELAAAFEAAGKPIAPPSGRDGGRPGRIESSVMAALPPATPAARAPVASVRRSSGPLSWPLRGVLYARFGRKGRSPHDGIDLAAPAGTPVRTAAEGAVLFAGPQQGYGLLVIIEHPHGLVTVYAHNRDLRVRTGQQIREGQVIATVGESGNGLDEAPDLLAGPVRDLAPAGPRPELDRPRR
jgi:murein DD-endopeptidase MepM/ murein hydrolase activator NlpD